MEKKKILGLDIGVASIGWALIEDKGNRNVEIIDMGVRIVPTGDFAKAFSEGGTASISAERTQKRGIRRGYQRKKLRKENLKQILQKVDMYPNEDLIHIDALTLFGLRAKAANKPLSLQELGRVFMHINQKRGFKSNRKAVDKEAETTEFYNKFNQCDAFLKKRTIGETLYDQFKEYYDTPKDKRGVMPTVKHIPCKRDKYEEEFDKIWEVQSANPKYADILTPDLKRDIKDRCIFYQRPLKSKKNELSKCEFEPNNRVTPKSSPFFQSFRIWQKINDVTIIDDERREFKLTEKDREKLVAFLDTQEGTGQDEEQGIKADRVLEVIGYTPTKKYSIKKFQKLPTNRTRARLLKAFDDANITNKKLLEFDPFAKNPEDCDYYRLWHLLYSVEVTGKSTHLRDALMKKFELTEHQANILIKVDLEDDYSRLSTKAIKKILPYLRQGYDYYYSCEQIEIDLEAEAQKTGQPRSKKSNYKNPASRTKEETREQRIDKPLAEVKRNELRNPVVEKILNQLVNLVKEIIKEHGEPNEIVVELARDLKKSQKQRDAKTKKNRKIEAERKKAIKEIKEECNWMTRVSKKDIERYLLWRESNETSLYTGKKIQLCDLFGSERKYDIDHIIPKARMFDDSFLNKTLCESKINEDKGDSTAEDYIQNKRQAEYMEYIQRIKACKTMSPQKKKYLRMTASEIPDDFINQHLANTRYISRETLKRLKRICNTVRPTTGQLTSHLRNIWGLNEVMYETFRKQGDKSKKPSKRTDHRHHAVDALVVACTKQGIITKLNSLNAREIRSERAWYVKEPWDTIKQDTKKALANVLISFKNRKRLGTITKNKIKHPDNIEAQKIFTPRGSLHEDTIRGSIKWYEKRSIFDVLKAIDTIQNETIKEELQQILNDHDGDIKQAKKFLKKNLPPSLDEASDKVTCVVTKYTKRIDLAEVMTDKQKGTSAKDKTIQNIFDKKIRKKVEQRIAQHNGHHVDAFTNYKENPIYLDELKQIPIYKVKIIDNITPIAVRPIYDHNGEPILDDKGKTVYGNFTRPDNNYTMAIYSNEKGKLAFKKITFWEAIQRKNQKIPIITPEPHEGWELITTLFKGEMFIVPNGNEDINEDFILDKKNRAIISKHLYVMKGISSTEKGQINLSLKHHLSAEKDDRKKKKEDKETSYNPMKTISGFKELEKLYKVSINRLGMITDVQKIL